MSIDYDQLRKDIEEECGNAMFSGSPAAFFDLLETESATGDQLVSLAEKIGLDVNDYDDSLIL